MLVVSVLGYCKFQPNCGQFSLLSILPLYSSAGVCGIIRTKALGGLNASEYICELWVQSLFTVYLTRPDDTVPMLIWSATESCVTIMCSSIPVLRPLYVQIKYGKDGKSGSSGNTSYKLPMYGSGKRWGKFSRSGLESSVDERHSTTYQTTVMKSSTANTSDENILRGAAGIERTDEISVSYEQFGKKV